LTKVRCMGGHKARVGSLAWHAHVLASGSRDRCILQRDVREPKDFMSKLTGHKQEVLVLFKCKLNNKIQVCGLKWSFEGNQLASGGNDNKLLIWDCKSTSPIMKCCDHVAAVKAIAWSPHQARDSS
jgi:cell division cycle 20-like protein 1 (cofactor of APC complex)